MNTNERCEPPPGTEMHTHHWIGPAKGDVEPWLWAEGAWWRGHQFYTPQEQAARGWVYDSPCPPPAVVAALVEALEGWTNALDAKREFERQSPGNSTKAWDRLFYAVEAAETEARAALTLYREAGR